MPATRRRNVGWKIDTGVSRLISPLSCPVENTRTHRATTPATNSIRAESLSTTSVMPSGIGQSPIHSASGPELSVAHMNMAARTTTPEREPIEMTRCRIGRRGMMRVRAAPKMVSITGTGMRFVIR